MTPEEEKALDDAAVEATAPASLRQPEDDDDEDAPAVATTAAGAGIEIDPLTVGQLLQALEMLSPDLHVFVEGASGSLVLVTGTQHVTSSPEPYFSILPHYE